jgi:DNA-binding transcriptional MerR regulator
MPLINQIIEMRQQGMQDKDIAKILREQGFQPKEITDALSQSKIKSAVAGDDAPSQNYPYNQENYPEQYAEQSYSQYPQNDSQQQKQYPYSQNQNYPQGNYPEQYAEQSYSQQYSSDTDLIKQIAEEIAEEKVSELREKILDASESKKDIQSKIDLIDKRLTQIEKTIDKLQLALLGKMSDYSKQIKSVTKELKSTQDTFKKIIKPVSKYSSKKKK